MWEGTFRDSDFQIFECITNFDALEEARKTLSSQFRLENEQKIY